MQDVLVNTTKMKNKIIVIIACGLLGWLIGTIHETRETTSSSSFWIYALLFVLVALVPILKFIFPKLKDFEIGTLNFYPNVIKYLLGKKRV